MEEHSRDREIDQVDSPASEWHLPPRHLPLTPRRQETEAPAPHPRPTSSFTPLSPNFLGFSCIAVPLPRTLCPGELLEGGAPGLGRRPISHMTHKSALCSHSSKGSNSHQTVSNGDFSLSLSSPGTLGLATKQGFHLPLQVKIIQESQGDGDRKRKVKVSPHLAFTPPMMGSSLPPRDASPLPHWS